MAVIVRHNDFAKNGADIIYESHLGNITPEEYVAAHLLGITSRRLRTQMYAEMLDHGLSARNDSLSLFALATLVSLTQKHRQTYSEPADGILEPMWSLEKRQEQFLSQYDVLTIVHLVVHEWRIYTDQTERNVPDYRPRVYGIVVEKTWLHAVNILLTVMTSDFWWGSKPVLYDHEINAKAFKLLAKLGTDKHFEGIWRNQKNIPRSGLGLDSKVRKDVLERWRGTVNMMKLEQVTALLTRTEWNIPEDMLMMLKIEFVRKGGALNLGVMLPA